MRRTTAWIAIVGGGRWACGDEFLDPLQFLILQRHTKTPALKVVELVVAEEVILVGVAEAEDALECCDAWLLECVCFGVVERCCGIEDRLWMKAGVSVSE